ncbi:hypothetical protein [Williamsia sp.]|uniref:hypothetical protein n=1 Tax=Williamsia sp. TaxID=1872085 RepID=UPI001A336B2F|nr:hypothetical protein [Williamsia sp.]MBJ7289412.1 hypothetical protein [Williamsia sp.]
MTRQNHPTASAITAAWNPFAEARPPRSPFADIPDSERLDPNHPLIALAARAVTAEGLPDATWDALKAKPIHVYGHVISRARRAYNIHRRDQSAQGLPLDPKAIDRIRDDAIVALTRLVPAHQRSADGELAKVMQVVADRPPRPGTGAGAFRRALRARTTTKDT